MTFFIFQESLINSKLQLYAGNPTLDNEYQAMSPSHLPEFRILRDF
jgi:hypothetical protein